MRIIRCSAELTLTDSDNREQVLKQDEDYIVPDVVVDLLIQSGNEDKIISNIDFYEYSLSKKYEGQPLDNKSLITFRNGGIGDLLFQLPALQELKRLYPTCNITVCCNQKFTQLFEEVDCIDNILNLPITINEIDERDYFVNFEGLIESNPRAEVLNSYDLHNEKFFVAPENNLPILKTTEQDDKAVKTHIRAKKNIVIAFAASVAIRSVNPTLWKKFIESVTEKDIHFYIVGSPSQKQSINNFIGNLKCNRSKVTNWGKIYPNDLKKLLSLVKISDLVIAPDSGLLHIAGGLGTKLIGIYGPFPSELRIKYYKNAIGLDSKSNCFFARGESRSCFQHGNGSCLLAQKMMDIYSPCMTHDISHLFFAVEQFMKIEYNLK